MKIQVVLIGGVHGCGSDRGGGVGGCDRPARRRKGLEMGNGILNFFGRKFQAIVVVRAGSCGVGGGSSVLETKGGRRRFARGMGWSLVGNFARLGW